MCLSAVLLIWSSKRCNAGSSLSFCLPAWTLWKARGIQLLPELRVFTQSLVGPGLGSKEDRTSEKDFVLFPESFTHRIIKTDQCDHFNRRITERVSRS